jgi:antirestriction protein ArdC
MPPLESFRDAEAYYSTLAHETVHWTKKPERLDRDLGRKQWGDEGYAMEELVAEIGAAFLCADLDLTPGVPGRQCVLYRLMAEGAEERQARHIQRSLPRPEGG